jgi:2-iminobutanoate/2-iminopropanoate deaminase
MSEIKRHPTPYSYSSAVEAGGCVYLGLHRGCGSTFAEQLRDTFAYLQTTLQTCGLPLSSLVKVNVWLRNVKDLPEMEKIFGEYFEKDAFPARMTATTEFFDADCLLMIDGIAYQSSGPA